MRRLRPAIAPPGPGSRLTGIENCGATHIASGQRVFGRPVVWSTDHRTVAAVAAGDAFGCAIGADQHTYCWGASPPRQSSTIPVPVQAAPVFTSIGTSQHSVCGVAYCWGDNLAGQRGTSTRTESHVPIKVSGQP